jgi:hypothetical protein
VQDTVVSPADSLIVHLYWQPAVKLERNYSFFVHLVDESGMPLGQGDTTHPAERYEPGQVIVDEYRIPLLPHAIPGRYRLIAGVYITLDEGGWRRLTAEDGSETVVLTEVQVEPLRIAPVTLHGTHRPLSCGYTLVGVDYDRSLQDQLRVYLHWRADDVSTVASQAVLFSQEIAQTAAGLPVASAGMYFTTVHDVPADATDLEVEVRATGDQTACPQSGPWKLPLWHRMRLPVASADSRYVHLGGDMILAKAQHPVQSTAGSPLHTAMTLVGARAITQDFAVSVSLTGETGTWRTQHDGTPGLGAVPTLKWIRGTMVRDEHDLLAPPEAQGSGRLRLTVYDAFTIRPLPVLDERLARIGQGTQIELGSIEVRPGS